jgi:uncharacterized protein YodC (DUF2158 family)
LRHFAIFETKLQASLANYSVGCLSDVYLHPEQLQQKLGTTPNPTITPDGFGITIEQITNLEDDMSFEAGDVVQLKSGGPLMTVEQVGKGGMTGEDTVWCVWFEKVGNRQTRQEATFRPTSLEKSSTSYGGSFGTTRV